MLKITRVHIKNFRSLRNCTFELKDLQLLIGPNNSGKTNLLRVFEFLRVVTNYEEVANIDLDKIRFQHKMYQGTQKAPNQLPDPVQITVEIKPTDDQVYYYYSIQLYNIYNSYHQSTYHDSVYNEFFGYGYPALDKSKFENLSFSDLKSVQKNFAISLVNKNLTQNLNNEPLRDEINNSHNQHSNSYVLHLTPNSISVVGTNQNLGHFLNSFDVDQALTNLKQQVRSLFQRLVIYKPDPIYTKVAIEGFPKEHRINGDGSNIVSYLEGLLSSDPERFRQINQELEKCIPDFKGYNFETISGSSKSNSTNLRVLRIKDQFEINHRAEDISDGTLYFLMLFAIIFQKDMPSVLMLEEPETGIHPRRISEIMNYVFAIREQYPDISIIITTHHPYVVDHFNNMTNRVWVIESIKGETRLRNVERDIIVPSNKKLKEKEIEPIDFTSSLGEHWSLGFLGGVPEPVKDDGLR